MKICSEMKARIVKAMDYLDIKKRMESKAEAPEINETDADFIIHQIRLSN